MQLEPALSSNTLFLGHSTVSNSPIHSIRVRINAMLCCGSAQPIAQRHYTSPKPCQSDQNDAAFLSNFEHAISLMTMQRQEDTLPLFRTQTLETNLGLKQSTTSRCFHAFVITL
jgi:hypothetical protein